MKIPLLIESTRTNFLSNSALPTCQDLRLTPGTYTLSIWSDAYIQTHGPVDGGQLANITGKVRYLTVRPWRARLFTFPWRPWQRTARNATIGHPLTFAVGFEETLEIHRHGHISHWQLEDGPFPTSFIPTDDGPVTRQADRLAFNFGRW